MRLTAQKTALYCSAVASLTLTPASDLAPSSVHKAGFHDFSSVTLERENIRFSLANIGKCAPAI